MTRRIDQFLSIIDAWKRKDIEAVLATMSDDIVWHFAAGAEPALVGKAQARKFLTRFAADLVEVRWRIFHSAESGDRLFVEGVDEFVTLKGAVVTAPYAGVIEFRGDLVCGWRDYVDVGVIAAQRRGEAASKQVKELADRRALARQ
jgi:limonene-1,2-epoxide hydrolase